MVKTNFFTYYVPENRLFSVSEVRALINHDASAHKLLAPQNSTSLYSLGTFAETISPIGIVAGFLIGALIIAASDREAAHNTYVINTGGSKIDPIAVAREEGDVFTGREVVGFLNDYENETFAIFNRDIYYDKFIAKLLTHGYFDAPVPTTDTDYFGQFNIAVLDVSAPYALPHLEYNPQPQPVLILHVEEPVFEGVYVEELVLEPTFSYE